MNLSCKFEDVQGCMNVFVDMRGRVDKPIVSIPFENVRKVYGKSTWNNGIYQKRARHFFRETSG